MAIEKNISSGTGNIECYCYIFVRMCFFFFSFDATILVNKDVY